MSNRRNASPDRRVSVMSRPSIQQDPMLRRVSQQHRPSVVQPPDAYYQMPGSHSQRPSQVSQYSSRRVSQWRRHSVLGSLDSKQKLRGMIWMENTYRLEPKEGDEFRANEVEAVIKNVLQAYLDGETYNPVKCSQMALQLSDVIKDRTKQTLLIPRHKLICFVTIGQSSGQSLLYASRCLWDKENDRFASASYQNQSLFATATVFAVHCHFGAPQKPLFYHPD